MRKTYLLLLVMWLSGCSLAPTYQRPAMSVPVAYQESKDWKVAKPHYANELRGEWWRIYNDPVLNDLEAQVNFNNQNVAAALARYQQACALSAITRSQRLPTIDGVANASRVQTSGNIANKSKYPLYSDFYVGSALSYELDVFGRVRNSIVYSDNLAHASAADLASMDLSMHAQLASTYFSLRGYEATQILLDKVVKAYAKALKLLIQRHNGGIAAESDVDQARAQLENAKTLAIDARLKQEQMRHAIAVLIGIPPADLSLPHSSRDDMFVAIPPELPSILLQRRPDIAAAELRVIAANAEIGVARAAFFPSFNLMGSLGLESDTLGKLLAMPSLVWSLGTTPSLALAEPLIAATLFDGGKLRGQLNQTKGIYAETVANYRQTVLTAFQEVEDNLSAQHRLAQEFTTQNAAAVAAGRALTQAVYLYKGGVNTILDIVVSENIALQAELSAINIKYQRQITSVQLIKALGGGWDMQF